MSVTVATPTLSRAEDLIRGTSYNGKAGSYPLYAFFLYSDMDEDLAEFIKKKGYWLHCLSGDDCLIGAFENPEDWGRGWKNHWQEKLGFLYWSAQEEWTKLEACDRNLAFCLADNLGIEKNALPCMVFAESSFSTRILCLPIVADRDDYQKYFQDIFAAVSTAAKADTGCRLQTLQSEWGKIWRKWILPKKIENLSETIQEWGSIIRETTCIIIGVAEPLKFLFGNKSM